MMKRRWMRSALATAITADRVRLPWERGLRRAAMIARRNHSRPAPLRRQA